MSPATFFFGCRRDMNRTVGQSDLAAKSVGAASPRHGSGTTGARPSRSSDSQLASVRSGSVVTRIASTRLNAGRSRSMTYSRLTADRREKVERERVSNGRLTVAALRLHAMPYHAHRARTRRHARRRCSSRRAVEGMLWILAHEFSGAMSSGGVLCARVSGYGLRGSHPFV